MCKHFNFYGKGELRLQMQLRLLATVKIRRLPGILLGSSGESQMPFTLDEESKRGDSEVDKVI